MNIFELFSIFDFITPTVGFIEDAINDPTPLQSNTWTFFFPLNGIWSASSIESLLDSHGIHHWGRQITGGEIFISVPLDVAGWAEHVMLSYGVPISEHSMDPPRP